MNEPDMIRVVNGVRERFCKRCARWLVHDLANFYRNRRCKFQLHTTCKACHCALVRPVTLKRTATLRANAQQMREYARAAEEGKLAAANDSARRDAHLSTSGGVESRHAPAQEDRPRVGKALPVIADARSTTGQPCAHRAGVAPGPLTRRVLA